MEWPEILGKECCVPRIRERTDAKGSGDTTYDQASEAFLAFSIVNGMDGRVESGDGLRVDIESAEQKGLQYIADCAPKPIWWAASSALAEGRSVTISCRESGAEERLA